MLFGSLALLGQRRGDVPPYLDPKRPSNERIDEQYHFQGESGSSEFVRMAALEERNNRIRVNNSTF